MIGFVVPMLRVAFLAGGICAEDTRHLTREQCLEHAAAAIAVETPDVPASLLLAIAYRESHLSNAAEPQCGVVQVANLSARACRRARSSAAEGYRAGVVAYAELVNDCRTWRRAGRLHRGVSLRRCALNYYAEGGRAGRRGWGVKGCRSTKRCDRSASVLARARRIASWRPAPPRSEA